MKDEKMVNAIIYILSFLFSPFLSLLLVITGIRRGIPTVKDVVFVIFVIGFISIYWFPWGDSMSHFSMYYSDIVKDYMDFYSPYFLYGYIISLIGNYCGGFVWGYYFWLFFPLSVFCAILWKSIYKYKSPDYKIIFVYLLLFVGVRELLDLNRNVAAYLLLASSFLIYKRNIFLSFFFLMITLFLHSTVFFVLLLLLIGYVISNIFGGFGAKILSFICLSMLALSYLFVDVLRNIASDRFVDRYIDSQWGVGSGIQSGFMYLLGILNVFILLLMVYFVIRNLKSFRNKVLLVAFFSFVLITLLGFQLWTIRERFTIGGIILGSALILDSWPLLKKECANGLFSANCFLSNLIRLYLLRFILILSVTYSSLFAHRTYNENPEESLRITSHLFYLPTVFLLDIDEYGYSDQKYLSLFDRAWSEMK